MFTSFWSENLEDYPKLYQLHCQPHEQPCNAVSTLLNLLIILMHLVELSYSYMDLLEAMLVAKCNKDLYQ